MSKDVFVNPQPPANYTAPKLSDSSIDNLTNDDFRKLLMTPSVRSSVKPATLSGAQSTKPDLSISKKKFTDEANQRRKEKKLHYASLMKEVKEREAELAEKYRDRAKERREADKNGVAPPPPNATANFRAVAPDFSLNQNVDRRMKIIEESKYLGGDLEHTHLVKGLDYALLQKVKAEIEKKDAELDEEERLEAEEDQDQIEEEDKPQTKSKLSLKSSTAAIALKLMQDSSDIKIDNKNLKTKNLIGEKKLESSINEEDSKIVFKTKLGRSVFRVLFEAEPKKVNELFQPHRMAYIVDLTNEDDVDVPITSIRSKADCPNSESSTSVTTNDIVINKLTQILSYLRNGKRDLKKNKKKGGFSSKIENNKKNTDSELSIYDDIGDYIPEINKEKLKETNIKQSKREYFEKDHQESERQVGPSKEAASEFIRNIVKGANKQAERAEREASKDDKTKPGMSIKFDQDSYSECYPGTRAEEDVNIDSDEDADFSKMDLGSKKGPVNRWDFETESEYTSYMNNREAMPKAAFQFGVKMGDGRKTRNKPGDSKNEKIKLDKEWNQISKLIDKRKSGDFGSFGTKKPKY